MRAIPLSVMLSWPSADYEHPQTRGPGLVVVNSVFISIATVAVALRLYLRAAKLRSIELDDVFIAVGYVLCVGMTACVLLANVSFGWDRHVWDLHPSRLSGALMLAWITKLIFTAAGTFIRLSLLVFYYRLARDTGFRWFRYALNVITALNILNFFIAFFFVVFECKNPSDFWQFPPSATQQCLDDGKMTLALGAAATILDLLTTAVPIPVLVKLELPNYRRYGAVILVSLGFAVTIAGAFRTYFIWQSLIETFDETWQCYGVWVSAAVEIDLGIICACAPALRQFCIAAWNNHVQHSNSSEKGSISKVSTAVTSIWQNWSWKKSTMTTTEEYRPESSMTWIWDEPYCGTNKPTIIDPDRNFVPPSPIRIGNVMFDMVTPRSSMAGASLRSAPISTAQPIGTLVPAPHAISIYSSNDHDYVEEKSEDFSRPSSIGSDTSFQLPIQGSLVSEDFNDEVSVSELSLFDAETVVNGNEPLSPTVKEEQSPPPIHSRPLSPRPLGMNPPSPVHIVRMMQDGPPR